MDRILFAVFTHENKSQGVSTPLPADTEQLTLPPRRLVERYHHVVRRRRQVHVYATRLRRTTPRTLLKGRQDFADRARNLR